MQVAPAKRRPDAGQPTNALWGLLLIDVVLIAADILQRQQFLTDARFLVTYEGGAGELIQYCKAAGGAVLLSALAARRASLSALAWALVFLVILADDALAIHERAGIYLAEALPLSSFGALRGNQVGELIVFAALGCGCVLVLAAGWYAGTDQDHRLSRVLLVWFTALGFCAVALDALSSLFRRSAYREALTVLEDGGELLLLSFLLASVWKHSVPVLRAHGARSGMR